YVATYCMLSAFSQHIVHLMCSFSCYLCPCFFRHCSFFFFYSSRHHPDLHSFPTRRSSDLSAPLIFLVVALLSLCVGACQFQGDQDRKSTRLNSSHEWISYAVFCLKKKKKNN